MTKILIIEDDALILKMYSQAFTAGGFTVETAPNGKEGFEKAKTAKADLILLDIMMPEMNGMEALVKLKENEELKSTPVIMLTNLSGTQDMEKAKKLGAVSYLVKSQHKPREVVEKVKAFLSKK